jgi:tetratricopeptide (TPR) repeat protein
VALYEGRLGRANELCQQFTSEAAARTGLNGAAAQLLSNFAQTAATFGDASAARASVKRSLELNRNVGTLLNSAYALVVVRDVAEAQRLSAEAEKQPGADTEDAQTGFKQIGLLIRWRRGDRTVGEALMPPKNNDDLSGLFINGVVNLDLGHPEVAATHFKRIIDNQTRALSTLKASAPLFYARALAAQGKLDDSRKAYDQFFALFTSADAGLPILVAAKAEYQRLKTAG